MAERDAMGGVVGCDDCLQAPSWVCDAHGPARAIDMRPILEEAQACLAGYVSRCPCPGMPCGSSCPTCDATQGLINRIRELLGRGRR